jgi:hypothetical protein
VRLTLKEKERRLAVALRMAKLEEDTKKHAVTMVVSSLLPKAFSPLCSFTELSFCLVKLF